MARIRTIKPEAFTSESLAEVSLTAERTFFGLLTQADDHGRFRDNAAIIAGLLWPLRAEHTPVHVEDDLTQLATAGLICRYTGCDGRRYLHIVTWRKHQKIDKPSQSRLPACSGQAGSRCGPCAGVCERSPENAVKDPRGLAEVTPKAHEATGAPAAPHRVRSAESPRASHPRSGIEEDSPKPPRTFPEASAPGSRISDPGSSDPSGRVAPAPAPVDSPTAKQLIGEYVAACGTRPPGDVVGHLGRVVKQLLGEGIAPEHVRAGLRRFAANPKHPSVLASMVNEAMNGAGGAALVRPGSAHTVPPVHRGHRSWSNPADPAAAYAEEL